MFLKKCLLIIESSVLVALLFGFLLVSMVLAAGSVGNGNGINDDELTWPLLVLGGVFLIEEIISFVLQRRSQSQKHEAEEHG